MERIEAPAQWRKPSVHRYSPFLLLPRQRPTLHPAIKQRAKES